SRRTLALYLPYKVASLEGLMHGLYLLWWVQGRHLSPATVGTVIAAGELAVAMVLCWLAEGATGLLLATVLVAVGDAFRSGADEALLYRTCLALDREQ